MGNKKMLVLMLSLIFFMTLFGLTLRTREKLTYPERIITDTVSWTQGLFNKPASFIAGVFEDIGELRVLYQENKALRMTLSQYARDTMRLNDLEAQNKRLKDLLGFTEQQKAANNYIYHVAEVVAYSPDTYSSTITINLGTRDGIKPNMAVMSVDGLIGRISHVTDFHSKVQLLTGNDSDAAAKGISATIKGKEDSSFGIVSYDIDKQALVMTKIPQTDELAPNDVVITSGLGEIFPKGIVIGKVLTKEVDRFGLNYMATVEPAAKFTHLREVLVVEVPDMR
ncbi:rod shape-determining protein MreC [Paenibacillus aurantius]|uniref:Cell shape-determining protein MreC n=1 Tax=Paenibacillus aurantius TaxID=2918900 RepID=A0AA96RGF2_9BACL|nr:rod shape-determining protein MreC [Paenibacillus aurantius]WNQ12972.1 rod shape-determining protein MreC [Paenibacillus aurantius]